MPDEQNNAASGAGHNSDVGGITAGQLTAYVERIERLEEEKAALAADIREVYAESKANGFDVKVVRALIQRRKKDSQDVSEFDALLDRYIRATGGAGLFA